MQYKFDDRLASMLKYSLQEVVYYADRSRIAYRDADADKAFNDALTLFNVVAKEVAVFQQDQEYLEQQADMADYIRRLEDEIPY